MRREHKFEMLEHTADVGVIGRGPTMADAFESVAYGMFSIMADLQRYQPTALRQVSAAGSDEVELLQSFLSQLIILFDAEGVLPLEFEITQISLGRLTCRVRVRTMGPDIEWLGPSIKAVTYHQMVVESKDSEWRAQAIFDV